MGSNRLLAISVATILASAASVRATTELTGSHNNQFDGYAIAAGAYDVPADTAGVPSATFNDNQNDGMTVTGATTSLTIEGGQFDGNFNFGVDVGGGATLTISGGEFDNNTAAISALSSSLTTIYGGDLTDGLYVDGGTVEVYGGQFGTGPRALTIDMFSGRVDLYGAFEGVADGQTMTLPDTPSMPGSFYGQLEDNAAPQTYTYSDFGQMITLHGTGTLPEPATLGLIGLAGITLRARRPRK